jgi:hypothetical protein
MATTTILTIVLSLPALIMPLLSALALRRLVEADGRAPRGR